MVDEGVVELDEGSVEVENQPKQEKRQLMDRDLCLCPGTCPWTCLVASHCLSLSPSQNFPCWTSLLWFVVIGPEPPLGDSPSVAFDLAR